jgi:EAL domain-containing protein (putative c-di-GMP-specific phosphodiesterase class I)
LQLENELRAALAGDGLTLHYQPILDLHTRSLLAVEALVRWPHPQLGLLRPGEFLPLAEEAGLLGLLDEWVLHTALKQVAAWQAAGQPLTVSVNLGGPALRRANLVEKVAALLAETGVPSAQLVLEITEHMALHDMETTHAVLSELQQLGVRIALDDFGTGYASLSHLRELPVDILKIERVFAQGIGCSAKDEAVIQSMLALGRGLDIIVVAEGVEEEAQRDWLQAAGCRHIQGYLISRPVPPASINGVHG